MGGGWYLVRPSYGHPVHKFQFGLDNRSTYIGVRIEKLRAMTCTKDLTSERQAVTTCFLKKTVGAGVSMSTHGASRTHTKLVSFPLTKSHRVDEVENRPRQTSGGQIE